MAHRITEDAKLGRFEIIDQIGAGGMGTVYRAFDPRLERKIAIKVLGGTAPVLAPGTTLRLRQLSPELLLNKEPGDALVSSPRTDVLSYRRDGSAQSVDLLAEARAMAQLSHPNVVSVYEIGSSEENLFIAMELVEGLNLSQWLAKQERDRDDIIKMFRQAAAGLAAAHRAGLVHRDFKPDNVLVSEDGLAQVADFGIAAPALAREHFAGTRSVVAGTPHYMAPEILDGADPTASSDVYAFCVALLEALGGEHRPEPLTFDEARSLVKSLGRLPRPLRQGLARGLCTDPSIRPANGRALEAMLAPRRAARASVAVLGILAVGIVATVYATTRAEQSSCDVRWERLDAIWNESRAADIRERVAPLLGPDAMKKADGLVGTFNRTAESLRARHGDVCVATERGELSTEAAVSERRCIEERLVTFEALLDTFGREIKPKDVDRLAKLAESPVALCASGAPRLDDEARALRRAWERLEIERKLGEKPLKVAHAEFLELIARPQAKADKRLWAELLFARFQYEARLKLESRHATLREVVAAARDANHVALEITTTTDLALAALRAGREEEAETLLAMIEPRLTEDEATPAHRARFHEKKARLSGARRDHKQRLSELRLALKSAREVVGTSHELHQLHDRIASNLALALKRSNHLDEAYNLRRELVKIELERHGAHSHWYFRELALLGQLSVTLGHVAEGFDAIEKAIEGLSRPENAKHSKVLHVVMFVKSAALRTVDRYGEARDLLDEIADNSTLEAYVRDARSMAAQCSRLLGDGADAEKRSRDLLATLIKRYGERHLRVADVWRDIGRAQTIRGNFDQAKASFAKALSIRKQIEGHGSDSEAWLRPHVAELAFKRGRFDEAEPQLRKSLQESEGWSDAGRGAMRADHALSLLELGRVEEALKVATIAQGELKKAKPKTRARNLFGLGRAEYANGNREKGRELARSALDEFRAIGQAKSAREVETWLAKKR